ncbi:hypothetical protein HanPI659440_Chr14g0527551 [Helianthus annuus]|nr:hypothetical protein HanPI659440_Chr14g0527551 [Helianthus annuus]
MSSKEHLEDSSEEMSASLPPLEWSKEIFDGLVKNFKFPDGWGVRYPEEGQKATDALAGYITLFWDYFADGNFRLPATRFVLDILDYYKFHISQLHPIGMVRFRHFEFLYRSMHIDPTINRFRVFYRLHCSQGFYSFAQCLSAKKILLTPPKSFHEWKPKFFFIKAGVIHMKMTFRGAEDIVVENMKTPESEIWYQDLKDIPSIELPERALVAAGMSLHWKMDREDKPVYMEDDRKLWYQQIIRNFALPRDEDLAAQPSTGAGELINLGIGPEKKKRRVSAVTIASKKIDAPKAQVPKGEKKGLAPVVLRKPNAEPWDTTDIPAPNPNDPIDLESSPEPLLRTKAVKRKPKGEAAAQLAKKIVRKRISKKGNLDALAAKFSPEKPIPHVRTESSSVFKDELPPSSPRVSVKELLGGTKAAETEVEKVVEVKKPEVEVEKPVKVELEAKKVVETEAVDAGVTKPNSPKIVTCEPEKGKSIQEDPVITIPFSATTSTPVNVEKSPAGD